MKCLVLLRKGNAIHPALRAMLPKEAGKAKPIAWGPLDGYSHDLFLADIHESQMPIANGLAAETGVLLILPFDQHNPGVQLDDEQTIVDTLRTVVSLKPL